MSRTGEKLISKIIDMNDPQAAIRYGIKAQHFRTEAERKAFTFILDYAEKNRNQAPPYDTVVENVEDFNYENQVGDTYEYLVDELKNDNARFEVFEMLQKEAVGKFNEGVKGLEYGEWLKDRVDTIVQNNATRGKIGVDVTADIEEYLHEYRKRKAGDSFKVWASRFMSVNEAIGGYFSGSMYTWYGRSGRGKSAITLAEVVDAAMQGATVLIWALEMAKYEIMSRIYALVSAARGMFKTQINGATHNAGFGNKSLLMGDLSPQHEEHFEDFLKNINDYIKGRIVVRGVDCEDFTDRSVKALEADIVNVKADVVLLDPFYYMAMERNTSKTTGGDAAATSMALRHLAGRQKVVLHVITQAEETKDENDSDTGLRTLRAPMRAEIKKTAAVLEDATNTFGIDTLDGEGVIKLGKGRNGGEGTEVQLIFIANYGIIEEMAADKVAAEFLDDEEF